MPLSAFQQFCADTGCHCSPQVMALWTQRNDVIAELDKLKAEREQMKSIGIITKDDSGCMWGALNTTADVTVGDRFYAHPQVSDGKVLVNAEPSGEELTQIREAIRYAKRISADEAILAREAVLKAAQQGE